MIRYSPALMGALLCASALFAQDSAEQRTELFKTLDTNGDGTLTKDEIPRDKTSLFDRLVTLGDGDKDGKLTEREFVAAFNRPKDVAPAAGQPGESRPTAEDRANFFQRMDRNQDGKLSKDELPEFLRERMAPMFERAGKDELTQEEFVQFNPRFGRPPTAEERARNFQRMDRNQDGKLSKDEVPEFLKERFAPLFERAGKDEITAEEFAQFNPRAGRGRGRRGLFPSREQFFTRLDANGDGKITLDEVPEQFKDRVKGILAALDKGEITGDDYERLAEMERRRQEGAAGRNPDAPGRPGMYRGDGMGPGGFRGPGPVLLRVLDEDRDGRLSKQELAMAAYHFDELDANGDGHLDARELFGGPPGGFGGGRGFMNRRGGMNAPDSDRPARPQRPGGAGAAPNDNAPPAGDNAGRRPGRPRNLENFAQRFFDRFDKNKDGKLSKDEAQDDRIASRFAAMDADGDGDVTLEEFQAAFARRQNRE